MHKKESDRVKEKSVKSAENFSDRPLGVKSLFSGFSLIEMLVVIFVFSILAILSTQTLLYSLRGTNKSEALGVVRENVDFASSTMERLLRNAQSLNCTSATQLDYQDENEQTGSFRCITTGGTCSSGGDGYIASVSASTVRLTSQDVCVVCNEPGKPPFTCTIPADPKVPPSVFINVVGIHKTSGTTSEGAKVTSSTQVLLRNY